MLKSFRFLKSMVSWKHDIGKTLILIILIFWSDRIVKNPSFELIFKNKVLCGNNVIWWMLWLFFQLKFHSFVYQCFHMHTVYFLPFLLCNENCSNNSKLLIALKLNFQQLLYTGYDKSSVFPIKKKKIKTNTKPGTLKGKDAHK